MAQLSHPRISGSRAIWRRQLARFCDVWLCAANRSGKTIRAYRSDLQQFSRQLPKGVGPRGVRPAAVESWIAKLQKASYSENSIRRKLASLRAFYAYLIGTGRARASPLAQVRIRLSGLRRLTRVVPRRDVRALVTVSDRLARGHNCRGLTAERKLLRTRNALIVRLLCVTGVRVGELVGLAVGDVSAQERTLLIKGKGGRERLAYIADNDTVALLDRYLSARGRPTSAAAPLFPGSSGRTISTENIRQVLRTLGRAAATSKRVTPHMLRHTAATCLLENGADLRIVQEFLGHRSIRSTERYTHVTSTYLRRVLRRANPLRGVA